MIIDSTKKTNDAKPLLYADIQKGMKVIDNEGDIGVITECEDAHNVIVEYENEGKGIHCLVEGCELFGRSLLYVCL
jgi:preprotein translocase subunit YajC